ncbi:MAG: FAD-dependent oxidoreductase [Nanoarchaeota archaeon]
MNEMKKVVIIGGGFAGSKAARKLQNKCDVTLIDKEDFFEYTPGILRALVEPEHYKKVYIKHEKYLNKTRVVVGGVKSISDKKVALDHGKKVDYDYLVITSGSNYVFPIKEENVFFAKRFKHLLEAYDKIKKSRRIAIVGGGIVGVELAAELATHYKGKELFLIHSHPKLMERNNSKTGEYARRFLEKRGVEVILDEKIIKTDKRHLIGRSGKKYPYDAVFFTVGITPNVDFMKNNFSQFVSRGISVNEYLQLDGKPNIFVAGDVTSLAEEKTAQNAEKHGEIVAKNIISLIHGEKMVKYLPKKRMMIVSLGKYSGILEYGDFVMGGFVPAIMKELIEKRVMWGLKFFGC